MKTQLQTLFNKINKTIWSGLTTTVEETIAKEINTNQRRVFSSADLWNIQRRKREIMIR